MPEDNPLKNIAPPPARLPLPRQGVLIEHRVNGSVITQDPTNGYINATALCKKAGKLFADYSRLDATKAFLTALSTAMGIPIAALIHTVMGGKDPKARLIIPQNANEK